MDYEAFFRQAMGGNAPYPFQRRLAEAPDLPEVVEIPTGLGKTEAVVLAWLWRRRFQGPQVAARTPRRLVYCLPMRVLVEQTHDRIRGLLKNLGLLAKDPGDDAPVEGWAMEAGDRGHRIAVTMRMGGESRDDWDLWPERDAILVGTQDMLLSGALNRGYGLSRYRWPLAFAWLNHDCLWVMDEVQLLGPGLPTSLQVQAFREALGTWLPVKTIWMSATIERGALQTVDHPQEPASRLQLDESDLEAPDVRRRCQARKVLVMQDGMDPKNPAPLAAWILKAHRPGTLTLVVLNTVERATRLYQKLQGDKGRVDVRLVHSRFRPAERAQWAQEFLSRDAPMPPEGRIIVATQVVEAGVDLSAATLFTEEAPWSSLVQRFGRCNRKGEHESAQVVVLSVASPDPYEASAINQAREILGTMNDVGIDRIRQVAPLASGGDPGMILRRKDLLELFDTTPDLTGNDIDVQRWIRNGRDADVGLFWRQVPASGPDADAKEPRREEICRVPVGMARKFLERQKDRAWVFDPAQERWRQLDPLRDLRPGNEIMIRSDAGGYTIQGGFDPGSSQEVPVVFVPEATSPDSEGGDPLSIRSVWLDIATHTEHVVSMAQRILSEIGLPPEWAQGVVNAARWHDRGKAHPAFQAKIPMEQRPEEWRERTDVAKAPESAWKKGPQQVIRHEIPGALAALAHGEKDLVAYLVAAHHGKVRLTLRSSLQEDHLEDVRTCCGVKDGDRLPATDLGGGLWAPEYVVDLDLMELGLTSDGSPAWADRALRLLDELGPFRLAVLEAILRVADGRASRDEERR